MSLEEIKAEVCWRLKRRGCWGAKYMPVDALVDWLGRLIKDNGKKARYAIDELMGDGLLISHKKRRTVSLNPHRSHDVEALIKNNL